MPAARILQPNFYVAFMSCNVSRETLLLGKPPKSGSARLGHIPSLPWESQLPLKPCISLQPSDFEGNCDSLRFSPRFLLQFHSTVGFASQMWAARPCLGSIFEKLLHRKTFYLPAARCLQSCDFDAMFHVKHSELLLEKPPETGSARLGHIPSLPWESQLPLKPCISLHPSDFEGNCDSLWFSPRFLLQFHSTVRFASQMWATRPHLGSIFEKLLHRKTFCLPAAWILQPISILILCHVM